MKKIITLMVSLAFLFTVAVAPVLAGGGKNQNEIGSTPSQGDGSDAQDHQVDGE